MPDDPASSPAPSVAPPGGNGPPGAVPGPSTVSGAGAGNPGAAPPLAGPAAQAVPPRGQQLSAQLKGGLIIRELGNMLGAFNPGDEVWKDIVDSMKRLSKHFAMAPATGQGRPPMAGGGQQAPQMSGGGAQGVPMPQMMSGGQPAGMQQRGPVPRPR